MHEQKAKSEPRRSRANAERMENAQRAFREAMAEAAVSGYFGEVRVALKYQDGVIQTVEVEQRRTLR